ncbi:NAD(P)H-dependent glycerol-3-phosphate dehydrogenase [Petroclostridium sp. X23]|uniref:NAD(P)H-dependent glycerol-3-phosphate dehydrogenase n=1 Tax=Petroclostridium sp. X23 TaxID=3045146 RepID=UPI0024ADA6F5|nr:NAD(P)H-dependent glycerol-3-phosphate dehydrogenase [Petroclostridium sp. X23]WHH59865.1 NAD(P)H-dependent glycerol-3-phosphate dehydrogenase [Petroclostridium sp. X23]
MSVKVGVVGSGSWGTALAIMLSKKGYAVNLWSWLKEESLRLAETRENLEFLPGIVIPSNVTCTSDMGECIDDVDVIVTAVPSHAVRATTENMKQYVKDGQVIVNVSKGLEESSLLRLSEVINDVIPHAKVVALSGPSHAEEVARDIPTTCVAASKHRDAAEFIQDVFMNPKFRVYTNPDIVGVELGGALKNVIALAAGICDGLSFGDNTKAALMTRGIAEIARLGVAMGAKLESFAGLSGIGDLIVTCTSMHSRNRRAGILIGQGKTLEQALKEVHMVVEGVNTTRAAYKLALKNNVEMPIVNEAYCVLFENKNPKAAVVDLMMRSKTHEMEEVVMNNYNW